MTPMLLERLEAERVQIRRANGVLRLNVSGGVQGKKALVERLLSESKGSPSQPPVLEVSIIVVDTRAETLARAQTIAFVASLLGIRHVVLAVDQLESVGYSETIFARIEQDYR